MMFKILFFLIACVSVTYAQELPIPRFVTLRSDTVNLRSGPGERYPIEWVYKRINTPVEIIDAYEHWYKVRDCDNTTGWVHKKMLTGKRYALTPKEDRLPVYKKEDATSPVIAYFDGPSIISLHKCSAKSAFCLISYEQVKGFVLKKDLCGVYDNEEVN